MKTVKHLLIEKGDEVWSIAPDASVFDAIAMMAEKGIGALPVTRDDRLVGIVSERDYARKVILQGRSSKDTPVAEIMTTEVICADPRQSIEECMQLMSDRRIRHLPVKEEGRLAGVISIGDVVKAIIAEKQYHIEQLETFIAS